MNTTGNFNGFMKNVILRISEARDLGSDFNRFEFYNHLKAYTAAPPDVLLVNEKHLREYYIPNCCGVIITANEKDSTYLPADDRRYYVAWSKCEKEDFTKEYWNSLWGWYDDGGFGHVAAYLSNLDISDFDPKAPPPKTPAFWQIVELRQLRGRRQFLCLPRIAWKNADMFRCATIWPKMAYGRSTVPAKSSTSMRNYRYGSSMRRR
jgi:Family of unknown function (DUF5906)